ncbi:MAG: hypothetical protein IT316_03920 [Anaerolineales bacterium]|nr:hypothetical protein [Anaerolineales bacterium]
MTIEDDNQTLVESYYDQLSPDTQALLDQAVQQIVSSKRKGGKVVVITGSGPNLHEGVTTLIAELIDKGLIDGVSTSSAVVAHEMGGTLDRVKRVNGVKLGFPAEKLPRGQVFEFTVLSSAELDDLGQEMYLDRDLLARGDQAESNVIIKAAGNMAYPMGLRMERVARDVLSMAKAYGLPFERVAGWGCDPHTMLGAAARRGIPALVSVPQLIGGGGVGLAVGDSLSITERCMRMADMISDADVIIESAIALTQEIHDGPFETYMGHGIWADWDGYQTYSLAKKTLVRMDLDANLKRAWDMERSDATVQSAINQGLPKTKLTGIPFRMEMSGFARLENSLPLIGDIGVIWPVLAWKVAHALGIKLDFLSHPQQTPAGQAMRAWIVENVRPFDRQKMIQFSRDFRRSSQ